MDQLETIYKDLTGVDIDKQKQLWDERGKGYYGEFLVFSELYPNIAGNCKILMNLEIPSGHGRTTEIDLLLIHETGFYVFEVKHYKGTIYGSKDDKNWTQYFRTTSNKNFYNPILQNQLHIRALKRLFPGVPMYSYIVFTNPDCDLRVDPPPAGISVCSLRELSCNIRPYLTQEMPVFDISKINALFCDLKKFSPALDKTVTVDGKIIPFYDYAQALCQNYHQNIKVQETEFLQKTRKYKRRATALVVCGFAVCLVCVCAAFSVATQRISASEEELASFAQKFEHVNAFNDGNISISEDLVLVSEVILEASPDIKNAVNFSCLLTCTGTNYGVSVNQDAAIIVILKNGSVKEYALWNEIYPYKSPVRLGSALSKEGRIAVHEFYDINVSEISYIKLVNLGLWSLKQYSREDIANGYEIELYNAATTTTRVNNATLIT